MSRSRSYFKPSARARRGKKGAASERDGERDGVEANQRVAHNPTPFSYEVPPRDPDDWAAWDEPGGERSPSAPPAAIARPSAPSPASGRVLDVRPSDRAPKPVAVRIPS